MSALATEMLTNQQHVSLQLMSKGEMCWTAGRNQSERSRDKIDVRTLGVIHSLCCRVNKISTCSRVRHHAPLF